MKDINYLPEFGNNDTVIEYVKGIEATGFDEEFKSELRVISGTGKMYFSKSSKCLKFVIPDLTVNENIVKFIYNFILIFHFSSDIYRLSFELKDFTVHYNEHNDGIEIDSKDKSIDSILYHISILNVFSSKFYKYIDYSSGVFDLSVDVENNCFVNSSINLRMTGISGVLIIDDGKVMKCLLDDEIVEAIERLESCYGLKLKSMVDDYLKEHSIF